MFVINKATSLANALILRVDFLVGGKSAAIFVCIITNYKSRGVSGKSNTVSKGYSILTREPLILKSEEKLRA